VRTIEMKGMCCLGCTGRIYDRIRETPGVVDAAVSFEKGMAQIVIPADADPEPLVAALRFDKFDAKLAP
jgi:copper chaperone CopZ